MWRMLWPILLVVTANTIYNVCAKSTPETVNGFASLTISYAVAAACSLVMLRLTGGQGNWVAEFGRTNWTAWVLGAAIVGLEFGFICVYRAGWKLSAGNLTASIALACVLLLVGCVLYRETITLRQLAGVALCALGMVMMAK